MPVPFEILSVSLVDPSATRSPTESRSSLSTKIELKTQLSLKGWWKHAGIFIFASLVLIARRPDAILRAQFWAEDGKVFFQEAYNLGWWSALHRTYAGYFHTVPRLGASLALIVPLSFAPLILNAIAIGGQALPVNLILSARSAAWGNFRFRSLMAAVYLVLPNLSEAGANITNVQSFLGLSVFLMIVAGKPQTFVGRVFDSLFLILFGLTGPYCIFLLPVAVILAIRQADRWRWIQTILVATTVLVQACALLTVHGSSRVHPVLGPSLARFIRILAGQIYLGVLLGTNALGSIAGLRMFIFLTFVAIACTFLVTICAVKGSEPMRYFYLFSALVFAAALISPMLPQQPGHAMWESMSGAVGSHYWFLPNLAFAWTLLWCFHAPPVIIRIAAAYFLFFMAIAIVRNFREPALKDMNFPGYAGEFEASPPGNEVRIPINPENWSMELIKR